MGQRRPPRGPAGRSRVRHEPARPAPRGRVPGAALRRGAPPRPAPHHRRHTLRRDRAATGRVSRRHGRTLPGADGPVILAVAAMREMKKLDAYRLLGGALGRLQRSPPRGPGVSPSWATGRHGRRSPRPSARSRPAASPSWDRSSPTFCPTRISARISSRSRAASTSSTSRPPPRAPVVACAGPGPDPMVAPDGSFLTPPTPDAFAAGVARLLDDPGLRDTMGAAARRFIRTDRTLAALEHRLAAGLAILGFSCAPSTSR